MAFGLWSLPDRLEAARTFGLDERPDLLGEMVGSSLIRRIQEGLQASGFYQGPVDGKMSQGLRDAIRSFQARTGLKVDGQVSDALAKRLETGQKIEDLLQRLKENRDREQQQARDALLANPETARLVDGTQPADKADPTRDSQACFDAPTPGCLLHEAAESSKVVARQEMRDWALGELLIAQTRAGLADEAMTTAARIGDPRLILVALRDISETQARAGRLDQALAAARIIPEPLSRIDAYLAIGRIMLSRGRSIDKILEQLDVSLGGLELTLESLRRHVKMALLERENGKGDQARTRLTDLEERLNLLPPKPESEPDAEPLVDPTAARRFLAGGWAGLNNPDRARRLLLEAGESEGSIALKLSTALLNEGKALGQEDTQAVDDIDSDRYRAVVLARTARLQAEAGDLEGARATLATATEVADDVKLSYAKSFARNRIALAWLAVAQRVGLDGRENPETAPPSPLEESLAVSEAIKDPALRAQVLWEVVAWLWSKGADERARALTTLAETTSDRIVSRVSRVWVFAEDAEARMRSGQEELAKSAFDRGLAVARTIRNPWGRTRALARLASALSLIAPDLASLPHGEGSSK